MTEYGKTKCDLLEEKGFKANDLLFWIESENETSRVYCFVEKKAGSEVKRLAIGLEDDIAKINEKYAEICRRLRDFENYLKVELGKNSIDCCDAETSNVMFEISNLACSADVINENAHNIEEELPWDEVADFFDCEDYENWTYTN